MGEFGPADLSRPAADHVQAAKDFNYAAGNSIAQWVYGPGTTRSVAQHTNRLPAATDPATHITSATPPFLLMHGTAEPWPPAARP
ncbi:hypothetical protein ACWDE0_15870 [Streptomyces sp. 900105755]|uniref:hypothetical protein n=1 Tax=Streptomyces sp. 900105755 TaxID=3154389 RepID=UPI00332E26DF